jgi:hypothetical protein
MVKMTIGYCVKFSLPFIVSSAIDPTMIADNGEACLAKHGSFGETPLDYYFPIWYASLVFVLAGIGVLRVRRQFGVHSALICLTVALCFWG